MHEPPLNTYIGYSVEYFDDRDIVRWANEYLPTDTHFSTDKLLIQISRINSKRDHDINKASAILKAFVQRQWPDFSFKSPKTELYANRFFRTRLEEYLDEKVSPWAICRMIQPIEQLFDYPDWLGNMFNACDYVEPDWTPAHCRHLEHEVRDTLAIAPFVISPPK